MKQRLSDLKSENMELKRQLDQKDKIIEEKELKIVDLQKSLFLARQRVDIFNTQI